MYIQIHIKVYMFTHLKSNQVTNSVDQIVDHRGHRKIDHSMREDRKECICILYFAFKPKRRIKL